MPPGEDRALMFDAELLGRLAIFMGGRAAEELTCDRVSTGAMDDIQRATEMAYKAVAEYGLSSAVGPLSYLKLQEAGSEGGPLREGVSGVSAPPALVQYLEAPGDRRRAEK